MATWDQSTFTRQHRHPVLKVEGIGQDRRWFKWLDNFQRKIGTFKTFTPEQRKEALKGLLTSIDVFMLDNQTHWLEINFHVPLVGDELVYTDPSNKKLGYSIQNGSRSFMAEMTQKSYGKKNHSGYGFK